MNGADVGAQHRSRHRRLSLALRSTAVFLAAVGIFAAVMRSAIVGITIATPESQRPEMSAYDAQAATLLLAASRLEPGSAEYARTRSGIVGMSTKYVDHFGYTYAHMVPGILILLLAPIQFSASIRRRHTRLHRWSGRVVLVMVLLAAISAVFFGIIESSAPPLERPTIAIFTFLFLFAAGRAFIAIRLRDIARHREWMIRMLAMAIGIGTVRVVSLAVVLIVRARWETTFVISMWTGWLLSIAVAEAWIRYTRPVPVSAFAAPA